MSNQEVLNVLKKLSLEDIIKMVIDENRKEEVVVESKESVEVSKEIYSVDELIEKYPFFTRYNINKAIDEEKFPVFYIGRKKFFDKEEVEKWLSQKSIAKRKNEKERFKI